eukprot:5863617-Pleurochrysis_carterae.AAC.2
MAAVSEGDPVLAAMTAEHLACAVICKAGREEAERGRAQTEAQLVAVKAQHAKAAAEGAACTRRQSKQFKRMRSHAVATRCLPCASCHRYTNDRRM